MTCEGRILLKEKEKEIETLKALVTDLEERNEKMLAEIEHQRNIIDVLMGS